MVVLAVAEAGPSTTPEKRKKTRRGQKKTKGDEDSSAPATVAAAHDTENDDAAMDDTEPVAAEAGSDAAVAWGASAAADDDDDDDDAVMVDATAAPAVGSAPYPAAPASAHATSTRSETRRIAIPPHRMSPLKKDWVAIFTPLTELAKLQVRMNVRRRAVELRTSKHTQDTGSLQRGADFVKAYALGFEVNDAIALLRLDDLYLDSFEIKDVKTLTGDHLSRAIGRIAGQDGKTKFTIENASRTRIVLADSKIHILGTFQNIKIARDAIVSLILGSPPGKVYAHLRTIGARLKQRAF